MKKIALTGLLVFSGVITSTAQCTTVTSLNENFDSWKKIDKCWNAESVKSMLYNNEGKITLHSMISSDETMILSKPKIIAGTYNLTLDISTNSGDASLALFSIANVSDDRSYVSISHPSTVTGTQKSYTINLNNDAH